MSLPMLPRNTCNITLLFKYTIVRPLLSNRVLIYLAEAGVLTQGGLRMTKSSHLNMTVILGSVN